MGFITPSIRPASSETWALRMIPSNSHGTTFSSSFRFVHVATNEIFWKHMLWGMKRYPGHMFIYIYMYLSVYIMGFIRSNYFLRLTIINPSGSMGFEGGLPSPRMNECSPEKGTISIGK